jgi:maltooligosyltrehalose trehalohydrolase
LLFMGEEYGETNPFLYFIHHGDAALVQAVREGRRREFAAFGWEGEMADPQSEATFLRSRLDWTRGGTGEHAALRTLYADLLRLRRAESALRPAAAHVSVEHSEPEQWVVLRMSVEGSTLLAGFNFGTVERTIAVPLAPDDDHLLLSTDHSTYGGKGKSGLTPEGLQLAPLSAALLRRI